MSGQAGVTLVEAVIASTLVAVVSTAIAASAGGFARETAELGSRADRYSELQLARHRLFADAENASSFLCNGSGKMRMVTDGDPPPVTTIEYQVIAKDLRRIRFDTNKAVTVAKDVTQIDCRDQGGGEIELELAFGELADATRLLFRVSHTGVGP